jgi:hypothetical protein
MHKNSSKNKKAGSYQAPALKVIEIRLEQHILLSASGGGQPEDFHGIPW